MKRRAALACSVAGAVIVALDGTVLTVAQPALGADLHASVGQVQWTTTGYLIAVAGLLVLAGRLADLYGHRRVFAVGMLGFGAASAGIAAAPGVGPVVALRIVQGVFGALLQPATLGMLRAAYPPDRLRRPLAVRTAAIGLAAATGPVIGGALTTAVGWRAVFLVNVVPAAVFGLLALARRQPGTPRRGRPVPRLDLPGAVLLALCLAGSVHALVALPVSGWTPVRGLELAAAVGAAAAFVRHERRTADPLVPADAVGAPGVGAALGMLVAASAALQGALFLCVHLLQRDLGLDPLHCALTALPLAALMILAAPGCAVALRRAGARRTTAAALAALALGLLVLARATGPLAFGAGFALLGAGFGTVMVAATHVVVRQAAARSAGVAGGLQQTALNTGPVLGVATATTLWAVAGPRAALLALAAVAAVAVPAARFLPGRDAGPEPGRVPEGKAAPAGVTATAGKTATAGERQPPGAAAPGHAATAGDTATTGDTVTAEDPAAAEDAAGTSPAASAPR
ncbi:MFS transporter [Streptomyces sp. NPDC028635]|uniref:MFS transporter n=1 Tax=Streptomyces sp. NPDC028635 TaxID=3154800 RepID=UPI00340A49ED